MATAAEVIVICIDNSNWLAGDPIFEAQLETIKFYCKTKIKCNPENRLGLFIMGSLEFGSKLFPTGDLQEILYRLQGVYCCGGKVEFSHALASTWASLSEFPQHMNKRLLMFVGSPINMLDSLVEPYAKLLKERRVALDIVNFFVLEKGADIFDYFVLGKGAFPVDDGMLYGTYHYARRELGELVDLVNANDNSHILDVDESSVYRTLSKSILKKDLRYLKKKQKKAKRNVNVQQELELSHNEKNKAAAADDAYLRKAWDIQCGKVYLLKENPCLWKKNKEKEVKENVNVTRIVEVSCSEKNQAAAEFGKRFQMHGKHFPLVKDLKSGEIEKVTLYMAKTVAS